MTVARASGASGRPELSEVENQYKMPTQHIEKASYVGNGVVRRRRKGIRKAILRRNSKRITTKLIIGFNLLFNSFIHLFYTLLLRKGFYYLYVFG